MRILWDVVGETTAGATVSKMQCPRTNKKENRAAKNSGALKGDNNGTRKDIKDSCARGGAIVASR